MAVPGCPLCEGPGGTVIFSGPKFRVVRAAEEGFPAFYRVIWTAHVAEFSQLSPEDRETCMAAVVCVEEALREHLQPTKINLAALGNMVPHLHWHVIARFDWDSRFPDPVWSPARRQVPSERVADVEALRPGLEARISARLVNSPPWPA
ncbi:HIT family protein [Caenimonas aquaedulcis]|uniref:HIT family protein n=1 Tax=Caenimonas aquaedulcis TaxID=2793270 RepID=A0A931MGL6_9BURK|nr:HIT family protein [Caenimonas aquaedulcis]MBG9388157.1 HIT family protein [Caenimonas aquaedulcis]